MTRPQIRALHRIGAGLAAACVSVNDRVYGYDSPIWRLGPAGAGRHHPAAGRAGRQP